MKKSDVRRYLILVGAFLLFLCTGILHMWSIFNKSAVAYYHWTESQVSYTYSVLIVGYVLGTFVGGRAQDKIGPRYTIMSGTGLMAAGYVFSSFITSDWGYLAFYFLFALPVGFGTGWIYTSLLACVQKWFPDKKGFATGFAVCGFGLSVVAFSPLAEALLKFLSVPATLRVFGVLVCGIALPVAQLMKNPPDGYQDRFPQLNTGGDRPQKQYRPGAMMKTRAAKVFLVFMVLNAPLYFSVNPTLRTYAETRGLTPSLALTAVMCVGLFSTMGRLFLPSISDRVGRRPMLFALAITGLIASAIMFIPNAYAFLIAVCIMGLSFGGMPPMHSATVSDLFGVENAGGNFGLLNMLAGVAILAYPAIVNAMIAGFGKAAAFRAAFIGCIVIYIAQIVILLFLPEPRRVVSGEVFLDQAGEAEESVR